MSGDDGEIEVEVGFGGGGVACRLGEAPANRQRASLRQAGLRACQA